MRTAPERGGACGHHAVSGPASAIRAIAGSASSVQTGHAGARCERVLARGEQRRREGQADQLGVGVLQGRARRGALVEEHERPQAAWVVAHGALAEGPRVDRGGHLGCGELPQLDDVAR